MKRWIGIRHLRWLWLYWHDTPWWNAVTRATWPEHYHAYRDQNTAPLVERGPYQADGALPT
jgi:hypothetical protein